MNGGALTVGAQAPAPSGGVERLETALNAWWSNAAAVCGSPLTVAQYRRIGGAYLAYVRGLGAGADAAAYATVAGYRDSLTGRGLKPGTIRQHMAVLGAFFAWASAPELGPWRYFDGSPIGRGLVPPQKARPYDEILTAEQVAALWRAVDPPEQAGGIDRGRWSRNFAAVALLGTAEMRNSELRGLALRDIHLDDDCGPWVAVESGKGGKYREIDLCKMTALAVQRYLDSGYRPEGLPDTAPIFGSRYGAEWRPWSRQGLSEMVRHHVLTVCGVDNVRSHDLRHIGARLDLNSGMGWAELQAKLGHSSPAITQIYSGRLMARRGRTASAVAADARAAAAEQLAQKIGGKIF